VEIQEQISKQVEDYFTNRPDMAKVMKLYINDPPCWITRQILLSFKESEILALPPIEPLINVVMAIVEVFLKGKAYGHDTQPGPTT